MKVIYYRLLIAIYKFEFDVICVYNSNILPNGLYVMTKKTKKYLEPYLKAYCTYDLGHINLFETKEETIECIKENKGSMKYLFDLNDFLTNPIFRKSFYMCDPEFKNKLYEELAHYYLRCKNNKLIKLPLELKYFDDNKIQDIPEVAKYIMDSIL